MTKNLLILTIIVILILPLTGCIKITTKNTMEENIQRAGENNVEVDTTAGGQIIQVQDQAAGQDLIINLNGAPAGWPSDIALYRGQITSSAETGQGMVLTMVTYDKVEQIQSWYQEKLASQDWQEQTSYAGNQIWNAIYQKEQRQLVIVAGDVDQDGQVNITLNYTQNIEQ